MEYDRRVFRNVPRLKVKRGWFPVILEIEDRGAVFERYLLDNANSSEPRVRFGSFADCWGVLLRKFGYHKRK